MISQGCTLCIKSDSMVLCMGPAKGGTGPIILVPGGLFWTRRRAGVGCRRIVPDTHDYFLLRPKAGRLHPSSKSGPDMIMSCGDLRLVGSTRHREVVKNPHIRGLALRLGVLKVAPEPSPYMGRRAVWLVALRLDGVVFQKVAPELLPWPVGVLIVAPGLDEVVFQKLGWCSKSCPRILDGVGVPKSCPRIPTLYTTAQQGSSI